MTESARDHFDSLSYKHEPWTMDINIYRVQGNKIMVSNKYRRTGSMSSMNYTMPGLFAYSRSIDQSTNLACEGNEYGYYIVFASPDASQ